MFLVCGCRSQPVPTVPSRIDPLATEALTPEDVEAEVRSVATDLGSCYRNERLQLFSGDLPEYLLRLRVPTDGSRPEVTVVKASIAGKEALESCLVTVLSRLRFPAHPGKRITLNIPINEAGR